jgi:hypothetical protein
MLPIDAVILLDLHKYAYKNKMRFDRIGQVPEFETCVDVEKLPIGQIRYYGNDGTKIYCLFIPTGQLEGRAFKIVKL